MKTSPEMRLRGKTAIRRVAHSRPVRELLDSKLLRPDTSLLDLGCGRGDDVDRLAAAGFSAKGWDPVHRPFTKLRPADIVNLGYVINVVADPTERAEVVRTAWRLSSQLLCVSARMEYENGPGAKATRSGDGVISSTGTFQKYFRQDELRRWVQDILDCEVTPAAPGVMLAFRSDADRQEYLSRRVRSRSRGPRLRECDRLFGAHQEIVAWLADYFEDRGRQPTSEECPIAAEVNSAFGSIPKAFLVMRRVTGPEKWEAAARTRREDLMVHLGLERFGRRPRLSDLAPAIQNDIRAHFGTYKRACDEGDAVLFSAGDMRAVSNAIDNSPVGKKTASALYVHESALGLLPPILRIYEGCARRYYGRVADANLVKLSRLEPKVSYLEYPEFDEDAHPALYRSHSVRLRELRTHVRYFGGTGSPPILHRKETLVGEDYQKRQEFKALTKSEEETGLLSEHSKIGTRDEWGSLLEARGYTIRGHRLLRQRTSSGRANKWPGESGGRACN